MPSVSGGGHWGGGMHVSARDMARFGYLFLRDGGWNGERIVSEAWIRLAAPDSAVTFRGAGANVICIDQENDLVLVVRWIGSGFDELVEKVLGSIEATSPPTSSAPRR